MDRLDVTRNIRHRMATGLLPRIMPSLTTALGRPASPTGHIYVDSAIGAVTCAACDTRGAQVAYRFPDGRIVRFHGRCHRMWEDECRRVALGIPVSSDHFEEREED
jgi:hypothetical protein